jgi:hypothetical protein
MWDGMARFIVLIWVSGELKCFCKWDWTAQIRLIRLKKFGCGAGPILRPVTVAETELADRVIADRFARWKM